MTSRGGDLNSPVNVQRRVHLSLATLAVIVERVAFGTLFSVIISIVIFGTILLAKSASFTLHLHRSFLLAAGAFATIFILSPRLELHFTTFSMQFLCYFVFVGLLVTVDRRAHLLKPTDRLQRAVFLGGAVIVATAIASWWRFRGLLPWAMSGDARNHIRIIRETVENSGLSFPGYPGLANGLAGVFGGWKFDLSAQSSGDLAVEIRILAVSATVFLFSASTMAGLLVASNVAATHRRLAIFGTALLTMLPMSQLWLYTYLFEGFVPTALTLATTLAVFVELCRQSVSVQWLVVTAGVGALILALTYPLLVPAVLAATFAAVVIATVQRVGRWSNLAVWLVPALVGLLAFWVFGLDRVRIYTRRNLDLDGRISPVAAWAIPALAGLSLALIVSLLCRPRAMSSAILSFGVVSILLDRFLSETLDRGYYLDKTRWLVCVTLIAINVTLIVRVLDAAEARRIQLASVSLLVGLVAMTVLPVIQSVPKKPIALTMLDGWRLPTASEAQIIEEANREAPASVFWRVSPDYLSTQVMDIWLTVGFDPTESNISWGYRSDVFSIEQVCALAAENAPSTIWVVSADAQEVAEQSCQRQGVSVKMLDGR